MAGEKSGVFCAAVNCSNCRKKCPTMTFHRFPKEERSKQWVINCGRGDLLQRDCEYLWHNCVMCHVHFEDSQVMNPKDPKSRLISGAVPTLFDIPDPSTSLTAKRRVLRRKVEEPSRKKLKTKNVKIKDKPTTSVEKELGSGCDVALKIEERRIKEELTEPELEPAGLVEADSLTTPCLSAGKQPYTVEERTMSPVLITPELLLMHPEADGEKTAAMKEEKPGDDGSYSVFVKAEEMEIKEELMAPELDPLFVEGRTGKERTAPHSLSISAELKELPNVGGVKRENQLEGADLQKKWKNLRTCFKREYNLQTKEPSGSGSKKRRKYLYFDQLPFLKDSLEQQTTASNLGETNNPTDGTEEEDEVSETASQSTPRPKNITCRKRKPDSRQKTYEESLLEILKQKRDEEQEIDEDRYFLLSLLPEFKKFSEDQKYYAKTEMMTLMRRIRLSGNSNSQMFAYHNHNVAAPATTHQTMAMNSTVPVPPPQQISTNEPLPLTYQALSPDQEWDEDDEPNSSKTAVEYIKQVSTSGTAESSRASVPFVSSFKTPVRISHRERECHIGHKKERPMDKDSFLDIQEDKCDIFGKFVATGLRKLIGVQRVSAEKQILEVLYDCLLNTVSSSSQCLLPNEDQHTLERPDYSATLAGSR